MATNFTSTTLPETFNDDYADSDNYHQILFRSGRSPSKRTDSVTDSHLSWDVCFSSNIFKEGAVVNGGGLSSNGDYIFLQVHDTTGGTFASIEHCILDGSIRARVLGVHPQDAAALLLIHCIFNTSTVVLQLWVVHRLSCRWCWNCAAVTHSHWKAAVQAQR